MRALLGGLALILLLLPSCTEVELASHVAKSVHPPTPSQGTFKVGNPYNVQGKKYIPREDYELVETGIASWYGPNFHGKPTANGEVFNQNELTAAHRTLQLPSLVRVTNLDNGRSLVVRVNDRGPFSRGRIIDLSKRAAELLDFKIQGTAKVRLEVLTEESLQIAEAAKRGEDTAGYEVAMNESPRMRRRAAKGHAERPPQAITDQGFQQASYQETQPGQQDQSGRPGLMRPPIGERMGNRVGNRMGDRAVTATGEPIRVASQAAVEPVEQIALTPEAEAVPGHTVRGEFYPDEVVKKVPVVPTDIYVQAGSFSQEANAIKLAEALQPYGPADVYPTVVKGRQYYRVRIPADTVQQADGYLKTLALNGSDNAIIVVE